MQGHLHPFVKVSFVNGALCVPGDSPVCVGHVIPAGGGAKDGVLLNGEHDENEFHLGIDRYGATPCCYYLKEHTVYIAAKVHQLTCLGERLTYDYKAIAVFLQLRFFIGGRTPFREIRRLRAGGRITGLQSRPSGNRRRPPMPTTG